VPPVPSNGKEWLTAAEAAAYLKVKTRTIHQWVKDGKLVAYPLSGSVRHVWRFLQSDIDAMLLASSVPCSQRVRCDETSTKAVRQRGL
jgi:excisionase family DNA binding protein